jgi:hypothetical protein
MKIQKLLELATLFVLTLGAIALLVSSVTAAEASVCCEKTKATGQRGALYCQNVPVSECDAGAKQVPTSCESTSYCKPGVCYNSREGTCLDNTPKIVCDAQGGQWSEQRPAQCSLGCCILGDQAAFVSLVRCKRLSSFLGLQTNYKQNIQNEVQCVLEVQNQEKGACVYEKEFEKTCTITTRGECKTGVNSTKAGGEFFSGKLCTAEEIGVPCAPTQQTTCAAGKDGVYFVDSCGNTANIYDAAKINDKAYWTNFIEPSESCNPASSNANAKNCGNCNYLLGSYCRKATRSNSPTYGNAICADLNCKKTSNGKAYKHGESWCVYNDAGTKDKSDNSVGSRFYKHICINGEEVLESCADFRQEECIEDAIELPGGGGFSQAACRVNRWQDCTAQGEKDDCENTERRDCVWMPGVVLSNLSSQGACIPKNSPGLKFWEGESAKATCSQANAACVVKFKKGVLSKEECVENCDCLTPEWQKQRGNLCKALGDCGPKINWIGQEGYKTGFKITRERQ